MYVTNVKLLLGPITQQLKGVQQMGCGTFGLPLKLLVWQKPQQRVWGTSLVTLKDLNKNDKSGDQGEKMLMAFTNPMSPATTLKVMRVACVSRYGSV